MEVKTIMKEIQQLTLSNKFFIMEQTLKAIKKEELKVFKQNIGSFEVIQKSESEKKIVAYSVNSKSLAKDWLSDEDNQWDNLL
jgi:hypothetical protein